MKQLRIVRMLLVVLGVAMVLGAWVWRALRQRGRPQAAPGRVIEGEYRHARHDALPHPR